MPQLTADQQDRDSDRHAGGHADTRSTAPPSSAATTQPGGHWHGGGRPGNGARRTRESAPQAFFNLLLAHTIAGFFADPVYGGNRDMVGWKLIGFPGAQMSYASQISNFGVPFTGPYKSLADYQDQFDAGA